VAFRVGEVTGLLIAASTLLCAAITALEGKHDYAIAMFDEHYPTEGNGE
jgi:hypothetical protein